MAIGIENFPNITAPSTDYPKGDVIDDPTGVAGTPVKKLTMDDIWQTFMRALLLAGITANNLPDNVTNGYQYAKALGLETWDNFTAVAPVSYPVAGTVVLNTVNYSRYRIVGKTLHWQFNGTVDITGAPTSFTFNSPITVVPAGTRFFVNNGFSFLCLYINAAGTKTTALCQLAGLTANGQITLTLPSGAAFSTGTGQTFEFSIIAELN